MRPMCESERGLSVCVLTTTRALNNNSLCVVCVRNEGEISIIDCGPEANINKEVPNNTYSVPHAVLRVRTTGRCSHRKWFSRWLVADHESQPTL